MRVPVDGGTPTTLTNLRTGDRLHGTPAFLPGGRRVLFPAYTDSSPQICAVSLDDPAVQCAETVASLVASAWHWVRSGLSLAALTAAVLAAWQ